jgi:hypothetical protein
LSCLLSRPHEVQRRKKHFGDYCNETIDHSHCTHSHSVRCVQYHRTTLISCLRPPFLFATFNPALQKRTSTFRISNYGIHSWYRCLLLEAPIRHLCYAYTIFLNRRYQSLFLYSHYLPLKGYIH